MKFFEVKNSKGELETISKLEYIKTNIRDFLETIRTEKSINDAKSKPRQIEWNTRIYNRLETIMLKSETPIPNSKAVAISAEDFYEYYNEYCDLICFIEDTVGIPYVKNKPEFCNFCGIKIEAFDYVKTNGDFYQQEAVNDIDSKIANSIVVSAENAEIKFNAAEFRLTAKSGIGHRIQTTNNKEIPIGITINPNAFKPLSEIALPSIPDSMKE